MLLLYVYVLIYKLTDMWVELVLIFWRDNVGGLWFAKGAIGRPTCFFITFLHTLSPKTTQGKCMTFPRNISLFPQAEFVCKNLHFFTPLYTRLHTGFRHTNTQKPTLALMVRLRWALCGKGSLGRLSGVLNRQWRQVYDDLLPCELSMSISANSYL